MRKIITIIKNRDFEKQIKTLCNNKEYEFHSCSRNFSADYFEIARLILFLHEDKNIVIICEVLADGNGEEFILAKYFKQVDIPIIFIVSNFEHASQGLALKVKTFLHTERFVLLKTAIDNAHWAIY
ncbi:MAG: hypothetical protein WC662_00070 [Candidatus Paceibacterota bacterium]|jgi:hypothetical protein